MIGLKKTSCEKEEKHISRLKGSTKIIDEKTPLLLLAGPLFVEMFLNILLNNIDTLMLSHYSENAVGAVGNANQIMSLMIIMFNIIATATSVVVAQYLGAKQYDKMNMIYTLAFAFNFTFGAILSFGIVAAREPMLALLKVSPEMRGDASTYIIIVGSMLFLQACYNVMLQILRCNGYTKVGMYISFTVNIVNVLGNYLCLYGPLKFLNLGVIGVALATVTARVIALTVALILFYKNKIGRISLKYIRPFPKMLLWKMLKIGLPSAGENISYSLYQMVLLSLVNGMGNDAVNARVFCNSMISFAMVFSNSCAMSTQIITGHLVGAGKEDAAYKRVFQTVKISLPITVGLSVLNCLLSPFSIGLFTDNEHIIQLAFYIMAADILVEIGRCLNLTFISSLKAAGDYVFPLILGLFSMWLVGVPVGYGFGVAANIGVAGVFLGTASDECLRGIIVVRRWYKKKWCGKSVVSKL